MTTLYYNAEELGIEWPHNVDRGFNNNFDIMGYVSISYRGGDYTTTNIPGGSVEEYYVNTWDEAVDRFFAGTDHTTYDCSSSKGNIIIKD